MRTQIIYVLVLDEEVDEECKILRAAAGLETGEETPTGSFKSLVSSSGACPKERKGLEKGKWRNIAWAEGDGNLL